MTSVRETFGNIDIYLFDQLQKGRFLPEMKILDAGCGDGRNIIYFLKEGYNVFAVDQNPEAIEQVKYRAQALAPHLPQDNFHTATIDKMPFPDEHFDWVISSAVLHFAGSEKHFFEMLNEIWRVLMPNGILFARLASSIGIEELVVPTENGRFNLPDGSERFLVDQEYLLTTTAELGGELIEPIKTTNVQNLRCMTTWVLRKR